MTAQIGFNARIFYGSDPDALVLLANVRAATLSLSCDGDDLTPAECGGWKSSTHTLRDASFEWSIVWDIADAGLQALRDAYLNDTTIYLRFNDGGGDDPLNASAGFMAPCVITKFARDERLSDALSVSITAKPTLGSIDPSWLEGLIDGDNAEYVYDDITGDPVMVAA